jgi:2,5-diketo-D-gluconate reductase A
MPQVGLGVFDLDDEATATVVCAAIEAGYRSIDTAMIYGNENGVGEGIRRSGIDRADLFVTTKLWVDAHGVDEAVAAAQTSLDSLGLDYLDLYLVHWPHSAAGRHREAWLGLEAAQQRGLTRHIGVSNFSPAHLDDLVQLGGSLPVVNQIELHPLHTRAVDRENHARLGIITESWSPLARGAVFAESVIAGLAEKYGVSAARIVVRWHVQHGLVTVPKSANPARLTENIAVYDFELDDADMALIDALDRGETVEPAYYQLG